MKRFILALLFAVSVYGMDDKTAQTASITNANITTASSDTRYLISGTVMVTRAATTSASLTTTITYTDADRNTPMILTMAGFNSAGSLATTPANSITSTGVLNFTTVINVKSGTAVTYSTTYASSGATTMQYSIHMREEVL